MKDIVDIVKVFKENSIETEYHFVVKCNLYSDLRTKYLNYVKNYSIMQYRNLMASKKETNIVNLSLFIHHSLRK